MMSFKKHMSAKEKRDRKKNQTSNGGIGGRSTSTTFDTNHHTWPNILESENHRTRNGHSPIKNISSKEINKVESTIKDDKTNRSAQPNNNDQLKTQDSSHDCKSLPILVVCGSTVGNPAKKKQERFRIVQ
ncbi:uncharacterized protein LOC114126192 [Aphis gossypii]|uniref:uncharacterized protein LOC114126192 n=1 Tax=Aphis gossypii TaxID=80765 RepID=UPI002158A63B|nr:uncharacterized protein LOC114126192 [Aphis gossypii]XP_050057217.1 uncharacterized protein LOC114126192 [Aphis gossypii]